MTTGEVELLRDSAAALRAAGETHSAEQLEAAAARLARRTPGADLEGIGQGLFRLRESEDRPVPRPPRRSHPTPSGNPEGTQGA